MAFKPKTLIVPEGGTGVVSTTAYGLQFGGTTATGNWQNVAALGTSGQVLTSTGVSSLPTFQALSAGGAQYYNLISGSLTVVADSTTYYANSSAAPNTDVTVGTKLFITNNGTINKVYGGFSVTGTLSTTENVTVTLFVNATTANDVITTAQTSSATNLFSTTSAGVSVSAGDYIIVRFTTPAYVTNPSSISIFISFAVE